MTLLNLFCKNCDIADALQYHFINIYTMFKDNCNVVSFYDANVSQKSIYEPVLIAAAQKYKSNFIPLPSHNSTDKYIKISTILGNAFGNGRLAFSEELQNSPDWDDASHQLFSFEKGSKVHDDFPDALSECVRQAQLLYTIMPEGEQEISKPTFGKRKRGGY
jgi:hypothetical protein